MAVKVIEPMKSEIYRPICVGCDKIIAMPSQADMGLFRVGLPVHKKCLLIWERVEAKIKRKRR